MIELNKLKYLIVILFLFQSCKNNLTREKAKDLILQKKNFPIEDFREITLSYDREGTVNVMDTAQKTLPDKDELLSKLEKSGIITYTVEVTYSELVNETWWKGGLGFRLNSEETKQEWRQEGINPVYTLRQYYHHNGILTDKGKQYSADGYQFKIAETDFGEVTGILENQALNMTEVKYSKVYIPNEIGTLVFNKQIDSSQNTAVFRKYDDGWRVE